VTARVAIFSMSAENALALGLKPSCFNVLIDIKNTYAVAWW
jgi:hypothetical protein